MKIGFIAPKVKYINIAKEKTYELINENKEEIISNIISKDRFDIITKVKEKTYNHYFFRVASENCRGYVFHELYLINEKDIADDLKYNILIPRMFNNDTSNYYWNYRNHIHYLEIE